MVTCMYTLQTFFLFFIVHSPLLVFKRFLLVVYFLSFEIILEKRVIFLEKSWKSPGIFFMEILWPPCYSILHDSFTESQICLCWLFPSSFLYIF